RAIDLVGRLLIGERRTYRVVLQAGIKTIFHFSFFIRKTETAKSPRTAEYARKIKRTLILEL
ncbi:MAG: hypothetical protein M3447_10875, partial [Acidobacteriota bacterium]|nr:hypothetical protein [Acidobacteriota bacterium]